MTRLLIVAPAALFLSGAAIADSLIVEGITPDEARNQPIRGTTKETVLAELGEPVNRIAAVGEPPISSWEYNGLVVYFENNYVLHAVAKR